MDFHLQFVSILEEIALKKEFLKKSFKEVSMIKKNGLLVGRGKKKKA